jgi:endonuclease/exonuclease/phosphatase family metal-dependent hydrolase
VLPRRGPRVALSASWPMKILTINIWNRSGPWDRRFALLRRGLEELAPDVVGMQEVLSDGSLTLAHEIAADLGYEIVFGCAKPLSGGYEFGNAVLSSPPPPPTRSGASSRRGSSPPRAPSPSTARIWPGSSTTATCANSKCSASPR